MPKWMPLIGGMALFVLAIGALVLWLVYGGIAGKQRGLVVVNLRSTPVVLTLDDGQTAQFRPGEAHTVFALREKFPQSFHVSDAAGVELFSERVEYKTLVDAEFRIGIGDSRIVLPAAPSS